MPKLILKFDDKVIRECGLGAEVTIGRLPDNALVIDNAAVSGHHARIFREGDQFVVEDLKSRNGTYVNEKPVHRQTLKGGDVLLVGKHKLVFDAASEDPDVTVKPVLPMLGETAYLDTKQHRALLARLRESRARDQSATRAAESAAAVGMLRVRAGNADQPEYTLQAQTSIIGKSASALVRLHGWFKPDVAVVITRDGIYYVATPVRGKVLLNGARATERCKLKSGDVLEVGGLTLEFAISKVPASSQPASAREHTAEGASSDSPQNEVKTTEAVEGHLPGGTEASVVH